MNEGGVGQPLGAGSLLAIHHGGARILQGRLRHPQSEATCGKEGAFPAGLTSRTHTRLGR